MRRIRRYVSRKREKTGLSTILRPNPFYPWFDLSPSFPPLRKLGDTCGSISHKRHALSMEICPRLPDRRQNRHKSTWELDARGLLSSPARELGTFTTTSRIDLVELLSRACRDLRDFAFAGDFTRRRVSSNSPRAIFSAILSSARNIFQINSSRNRSKDLFLKEPSFQRATSSRRALLKIYFQGKHRDSNNSLTINRGLLFFFRKSKAKINY